VIRAEVHSDDHKLRANFDATLWFEQADDAEIAELANCNWGGDCAADAVAEFMADYEPSVAKVFAYLDLEPSNWGEPVGFECHVEAADARAWLKAHRSALYASLDEPEACK
jgi:hypothetical protein